MIAVAFLAVLLGAPTPPAQASDPNGCELGCVDDVVTGGDRFRGMAVLYAPGRGPIGGAGGSGTECPDCEWALVAPCRGNTPRGNDVLCTAATATCARPGTIRYAVYFRRVGQSWRPVDEVCLGGPGSVITPGELAGALRRPFEQLVPAQRPGFQPRVGALVQLPTIFYSGQPAGVSGTTRVFGFDVEITAEPTWTWRYEPGVAVTTTLPGAPYPNKDVTHTYTTTGARTVGLTTTWRGAYTVAGDPPRPIAMPVVQTTSLPLRVYQARSELVAPPG
jgi:hypothetical protein